METMPHAAPATPALSIIGTDFSAVAQISAESVVAVLAGNADLRSNRDLDAFLANLDAEAVRLDAREVVVDLRGLQFMNSSCIKSFITWISVVEERTEGPRYHICFLSNPALHWQKRSLHALTCFAADLISVQSH